MLAGRLFEGHCMPASANALDNEVAYKKREAHSSLPHALKTVIILGIA